MEDLKPIQERGDSPRAPKRFNVAILYMLILWRRFRPWFMLFIGPVFVIILSMLVYYYNQYSSTIEEKIYLENQVHELQQQIDLLQGMVQQFVEQEALAKVTELRE